MRLRVFSLILLLFNQIFCQDLVRFELKNDSPFMPKDQNSVKIYDSKIGLIKEAKIGSIVEIDIYQYPAKLYFYSEGFPVTEFILKDKGQDTDVFALENGYVSVVPVQFDMTAHHMIQKLNSWEL